MLTELVLMANERMKPIAQTVMMAVVALPGVGEVLATQLGDVTEQRRLLYSVAPPQARSNSLLLPLYRHLRLHRWVVRHCHCARHSVVVGLVSAVVAVVPAVVVVGRVDRAALDLVVGHQTTD